MNVMAMWRSGRKEIPIMNVIAYAAGWSRKEIPIMNVIALRRGGVGKKFP